MPEVLISENALMRGVGDEGVILDVSTGTYYGLDSVGRRVWELAAEGLSIAQLCTVLAEEFDAASETIHADVQRLLAELESSKLIRFCR